MYSVAVGVTNPNGWTLGVDHVMDDRFNDLADYQLLPYAQHGMLQAEGHEFLMLENSTTSRCRTSSGPWT